MLINSGLSDSFYGSSNSCIIFTGGNLKIQKNNKVAVSHHNYKPSSRYQTTLSNSGDSKKPQNEYFIRIDISNTKSE